MSKTPFLRRISIALVAPALLLSTACSEQPRSTYADAQTAYDQGEFRIARAHLADIFANGEPDAKTYLLQMRLMLDLGDGYAAMAAMDNLPDSLIGGAERRVATAQAYILQGSPHKAAKLYEELELSKYTEQDFRMALWALRDMGEAEEFESGMDAALAAYPDSAYLNAMAGDALFDLGIAEEAESFAKRAYKNDPDNFDALLVMGRVAINQGELETALQHYSKAAEISPHHAVPPANIAGLQMDLGKVNDAGKTLTRALADHPEFPFLLWQQARYSLETGNMDAARSALEKARKSYSDNDAFTLLSARIEEKLGNRELAVFEYRRYLRSVGSDPDVEARLAKLEG